MDILDAVVAEIHRALKRGDFLLLKRHPDFPRDSNDDIGHVLPCGFEIFVAFVPRGGSSGGRLHCRRPVSYDLRMPRYVLWDPLSSVSCCG